MTTALHQTRQALTRGVTACLVALTLLFAAPMAQAQTAKPVDVVTVKKGSTKQSDLDYANWERLANRAEDAIAANVATDALEVLRGQLVDWRAAFLVSQNTNSTRIATLRDQISALGPVPEEGKTEAPEIATRRQELADQLIRLQAPGIAAEEAYRRADGLIGEIDRSLRDRQADQLLQLWPAPINPANWPAGVGALRDVVVTLWSDTLGRWQTAGTRMRLFDNLPLIALATVVGLGLIWRGRVILPRLAARVRAPRTTRGRRVLDFLLSLGGIALPTLGLLALSVALSQSGMGGQFDLSVLPLFGFTVFTAKWLGAQVFPVTASDDTTLHLPAERRAEGRLLTQTLGWLLALRTALDAMTLRLDISEQALAVLNFPLQVATAILLFRAGQLLRLHLAAAGAADDGTGNADRALGLMGRGAMAVGIIGPALGALGYIAAANALLYPATLTLGLVALLFLLQRLVADLYGLITQTDAADQEGLVPILIGFGMTLASLPVFALIWGARTADITELWQRFLEGFQLGERRVSPTDFMIFAIIFAAGYTLTRLFQGALRGTVLPRTSLDQGGQNAIVSGLGYVGIFLSGLVAINSAGIDLSGLAIVAGALSVGIGFGLQNIVSNFVSGIILLIERPVSEGDWIEVGGVQGTVKSISVRSTRIQTFDRTDVIVPNSDLVSGQVTNWTRFNLSGRLIVPISVAYGSDTRKVERVLREIAEAQPLAVLNPPPVIAFMGFGADAMNFEVRVILRDVNFSLSVRSDINHAIVQRFGEEGIEIPFAQTEVSLRNVDAIARALRGQPALPEPGPDKPLARTPRRAQPDAPIGDAET
jgi:potassium efflux system protein